MNGQDGYDGSVSALRNHIDGLGVWLAIWQARDDGKPDAHARRAANDAVDASIRELHKIRARLISEIRVSDDKTAARVDAMLTRTAVATRASGPDRAGTEEDQALGTPGLE